MLASRYIADISAFDLSADGSKQISNIPELKVLPKQPNITFLEPALLTVMLHRVFALESEATVYSSKIAPTSIFRSATVLLALLRDGGKKFLKTL